MLDKIKRILVNHYGYVENEQVLKDLNSLYNANDSNKMVVGDTFILISKKPKCTIDKQYKIFRVSNDSDFITPEYWFYNDNGKPTTLNQNDYYENI